VIRRTAVTIATVVVALMLTILGRVGVSALGRWASARTERRRNVVSRRPRYVVSPVAADVHARLTVVDLHADTLLWGRDVLRKADRGHVDVPRMVEGNAAIQVFAASTKVPRHLNIESNDDRSDDVTLVALAQGWPPRTWRSLTARAEYLAGRLHDAAARSDGRLSLVRSVADIDGFLARRETRRDLVAGLLAIEGAHALDGDLANLDRLEAAGYRMVGLSHFFDTEFAGSAHGRVKGGLTAAGRELGGELERRRLIVDVAHASAATIDDVLGMATRPVVASHTGVRAVADNARNLPDAQLRGIAATGGLIGIGFWPTACGGDDAGSIARSIGHAVAVAGPEHVGLGSDFDGAVPVPFDVSGMALLTEALLGSGLDEATIAAVMGGNAVRLLRDALPSR
jgi:microsomal dipeptidase-like Zn-dependent dipeptidase